MFSESPTRRRDFMYQFGAGLGSVALSCLLHQDGVTTLQAGEGEQQLLGPLSPKKPHLRPKAKSIIYFVANGGPSHMDTFDPKPILSKYHGTVFKRENVKSNSVKGVRYFLRSPFRFRKYGACGMDVSDLFRETAANVDEMAFVRSVYAESDNHPAALFQYNTGVPVQGSPSIGSWMVYGLGTENQNWPAFVVLRDGKPYGGTSNWGNGYLPALYQGTQFRGGDHPVLNLSPPASVARQQQQNNLDLIQKLNRQFQSRYPDQLDLQAHIASYELAFRMQENIPEAVDLTNETDSIHKLYGLDKKETKAFGTRCLLARRMVERGVRFIQVWSEGWDSHEDIVNDHAKAAKRVDRPIAGLLKDLKQRGLLDETLVVWGGEFGRTVDTTEAAWNKKQPGRDHNPRAMTMWFAGGGIKGGSLIGATDETGENAAENRFHLRDVHATLLHLMGLDQEKLTYYHGGRFKNLTTNLVDGGHGEIITDMLL